MPPRAADSSGLELDVRLLLPLAEEALESVFKVNVSTIVAKSLDTATLSGLGCKTTESSPVEFSPLSPVTATTASARATERTLSAMDSAACCKVNKIKL